MTYDMTILSYFFHASFVVKSVMIILIMASVFSWAYILQRYFYLKEMNQSARIFEQSFWSGEELAKIYSDSTTNQSPSSKGLEAIFHAGYKEFLCFRKQVSLNTPNLIENVQRSMKVAEMREQDKMESYLSFLAIVGSTSPYIGLFGTVWGIMQALRALAQVQQASVSMVAPGIAEALIATALGLFAAIPAVVAYNRFVNEINRLLSRFNAFQEEFTNLLVRQFHYNLSVSDANGPKS